VGRRRYSATPPRPLRRAEQKLTRPLPRPLAPRPFASQLGTTGLFWFGQKFHSDLQFHA
jgi:hypothetical protein